MTPSDRRRVHSPPLRSMHERMLSLDVFRGVAIAAMIVLANPGSWSDIYPQLVHADWHGWTPTDLVFPWFLFIVGTAITCSLEGHMVRGEGQGKVFLRIMRRAAILFALGLLVNASANRFGLSTFRIPGVLQRIALCYFFAALIFMKTDVRGQAATTCGLLVVYWLLMMVVPVPGYGAGMLGKEGNLAAYIDNLIMPGHLYRPTWDPEGLLSTIPAMATTMFGVLAGHWLKSTRSMAGKIRGLLLMGIAGVVIGSVTDMWFPINKNLWTSSFAVFSGGIALLVFSLCYWLVEYKGYRRFATPFVIFGRNAIAVYVLSNIASQLIGRLSVGQSAAMRVPLWAYMYEQGFASWAGPRNGSLFLALTYMLFWLAPLAVLYRKRIFIRA